MLRSPHRSVDRSPTRPPFRGAQHGVPLSDLTTSSRRASSPTSSPTPGRASRPCETEHRLAGASENPDASSGTCSTLALRSPAKRLIDAFGGRSSPLPHPGGGVHRQVTVVPNISIALWRRWVPRRAPARHVLATAPVRASGWKPVAILNVGARAGRSPHSCLA